MKKSKSLLFDRIIKGIPFFACLSEEEIKELRHVLVEKHFSRNKIIFLEEDTQNYMYVILSGRVKIVHLGQDGKEHILAVHKTGDFFGEMALLDGKTAPATVIAMEDTNIMIMSKKDFEEYLLKNSRVLKEIISILCARLRDSWMMNKIMSLTSAEDRVRTLLKLMGMHYGMEDKRGTVITLRLTHQDIADYSSLSRETVTRLLNRFIRDGEIEVLDNRNILLKPSF
ncbi:MAG: Crp/Fnr family transcriptional regulator [Nitrospiraceae bacterium]|nr:Crp/Fnr family transcriptional regulator [Nitrospirota bacterium]MDA8339850.1 Crp/Fnr family transcriptional regulator [Nitrospiraceae bacterium]